MFLKLEKEKQLKILNAAFEEFADYGYQKASTNRIVKKAGIGKGMLFYYFNSKLELFYDLTGYAVDFIENKYLLLIDDEESDYIDKYRKAGILKMKAYNENPVIFNFFATIYVNRETPELPEELANKIDDLRKLFFSKLYSKTDISLFRKDIEQDKLQNLIQWTLAGYEKELLSRMEGKQLSEIDFEPYWDEYYEYLDILKKIFYV